tara:strand:+ start:466 stop:672 length:207 start_codon:yes stop_codon:yes gene_type:complete
MIYIILIFLLLSIGNVNYFKKTYPQVIHSGAAPILPHSITFVKGFFKKITRNYKKQSPTPMLGNNRPL